MELRKIGFYPAFTGSKTPTSTSKSPIGSINNQRGTETDKKRRIVSQHLQATFMFLTLLIEVSLYRGKRVRSVCHYHMKKSIYGLGKKQRKSWFCRLAQWGKRTKKHCDNTNRFIILTFRVRRNETWLHPGTPG